MERDMKRNEFLDLVRSADLHEFHFAEGKVLHNSISKDNPDWLTLTDHMKQLYYKIFGGKDREKDKVAENYSVSEILRRFPTVKRDKKIYLKKDNTYIVKKYFTEGIQYVPEGEMHEYEILGIRPIDLFQVFEAHPVGSFNESVNKSIKGQRVVGSRIQIKSDSYYFIVAPYNTSFIKTIKEANCSDSDGLQMEAEEDTARMHEESQSLPSTSHVSVHANGKENHDSSNSKEKRDDHRKRSLEVPDNHPKRRKSNGQSPRNLVPRPNSDNFPGMALMSLNQVNEESQSLEVSVNDQLSVGTEHPSVFGIRKNDYIESYYLEPDSTFEIHPDESLSGMFTIKNVDMDPYLIHYACDGQIIKEKSYFKNGSVFETPLAVEKDLLEYLRIPGTTGNEKRVVRYFYNYVFKKIEGVYKKFVKMQNIGMIGSCVPAIIQLDNTRFTGFLSDVYTSSNEDI